MHFQILAFLSKLFHHPIFWLILLQVFLAVTIRPFGAFPINDDWAYSHSVLWLLEEHRIRLSDWIAMNLLPQTLLGGAASSIFGFSPSILRSVTQLFALATSIAVYHFFVVCGMRRWYAFAAVGLLVTNPWWLHVANSYMSDIYSMLFSILAATAFVRYLQNGGKASLTIAIVMCILAILQRQVAMVLPLAFLLAALFQERSLTIKNLLLLSLPLVLTALAAWLYEYYLRTGPGVPPAQLMTHERLPDMLWAIVRLEPLQLLWSYLNVRDISGFVGLAVAAWGLAMLAAWQGWRRYWPVLAALVLAIFIWSILRDWTVPYRLNHLIDAAGMGPFTLEDGLEPHTDGIDRDQTLFWRSMSLVVAVGLTALLVCLIKFLAQIKTNFQQRDGVGIFLALILGGYFVPFVGSSRFCVGSAVRLG